MLFIRYGRTDGSFVITANFYQIKINENQDLSSQGRWPQFFKNLGSL
jgi:predicted secreted protein